MGNIPEFAFEVKDHEQLTAKRKQLDTSCGAALSGSRFVVLSNEIAQLNRALIQWMLDVHTREHGYQEIQHTCFDKTRCIIWIGTAAEV